MRVDILLPEMIIIQILRLENHDNQSTNFVVDFNGAVLVKLDDVSVRGIVVVFDTVLLFLQHVQITRIDRELG